VLPFRKILFCFLSLLMLPVYAHAQKVDAELAESLNSEANHETVRRKQFKPDRDSKKIFDNEREKGLGQFLEDQEKWDLIRERGLAEQKRQKKVESPVEGGPDDIADQKAKKAQADILEKARVVRIQTRERIRSRANQPTDSDEMEELGLALNRPRYDLRHRGSNRWTKNEKAGSGSKGSSGSPGSSGGMAPAPNFDDFPTQPDYVPAPQPLDTFDDIPPPPPPMNYDSSTNAYPYNGGSMDGGFGDIPPPPPPPPPTDFDF
jgi:hypothetical protein